MKQEQKNKILAGAFAAMVIASLMILLFNGREEQVDKALFKINNLDAIDRVTFESHDKVVELSYNGSRWLVDKVFDADDQLVTVLFATLQQVEAKRKVAASLTDSIANKVRTSGVRVSLYSGSEIETVLFVGGNSKKTEAYFMDSENIPYVMAIPGYRVYVAGVFEVDQSGWRDKRIFNFNWRNFKKLSARFTTSQQQNFEIEDQGFGFDMTNTTGTDTTRLNDYLDAVSLLMAKNFISVGDNGKYDSLLETTPELTIEILDLGSNKFSFDLFKPLNGDGQVVGKINETEGVIFDLEKVLPILRTRGYFLSKHP